MYKKRQANFSMEYLAVCELKKYENGRYSTGEPCAVPIEEIIEKQYDISIEYKLKMEALKRQGKRTDLTCTPVVHKLKSVELIGKENGDSREQVRRYIRLTHLIAELLEDVDIGKIALRPAVELSYLTEEEQKDLSYIIDTEEATPSLAQAIQMRKLSHEGKLDFDTIETILSVQKPNQVEKIKIPTVKFEKYFHRGTPQSEIETVIFAALDEYYKRRRRQQTK